MESNDTNDFCPYCGTPTMFVNPPELINANPQGAVLPAAPPTAVPGALTAAPGAPTAVPSAGVKTTNKKTILIISIVSAFVVLIAAAVIIIICVNANKNPRDFLIGTWTSSSGIRSSSLTFNPNGSFAFTDPDNETHVGTYTMEMLESSRSKDEEFYYLINIQVDNSTLKWYLYYVDSLDSMNHLSPTDNAVIDKLSEVGIFDICENNLYVVTFTNGMFGTEIKDVIHLTKI